MPNHCPTLPFQGTLKGVCRKPIFWILFGLVSIGGVAFSCRYYTTVFPIVTIDLEMDRETALRSARTLALKHGLGPEGFRQAAAFLPDTEVQTYVELEAGGSEAFQKMIRDGLYAPYTWVVRHFREGETNGTTFYFTPKGKPCGFQERLSEDTPGPSLDPDSALAIAEAAAKDSWHLDLTAYELVEKSNEVRPGGRTDHRFVYERPGQRIGEGRYRLRLEVGGDRLTELFHFVKLPDAFSMRYEEMRSANETIASVAFVTMFWLYKLGGCVVGLFLLLRVRWVVWRRPVFWGITVASLVALGRLNEWPLIWMWYDTALSSQGFIIQNIADQLSDLLSDVALLTFSFMAAESLTRKAFPSHVQLWKMSSPGVADSVPVAGRTLAGYLLGGFNLGFMVVFYLFTTRMLGWWTPSHELVDPNVLATWCPWLSPLADSLKAGFWEEALCRAVPLAGAALIGRRFGHRRIWIGSALFLQAIIFGALHANYSAQPAYARIVELTIPSLLWGAVYLRFGLLPCIIAHFSYDAVLSSLPLFVSSASGVWVDRALVTALALLPLWVVLYRRWRAGHWTKPLPEHYNRSWHPPAETGVEQATAGGGTRPTIPARTMRWVLVGGAAGFVLWLSLTNFQADSPQLRIERAEAERLAQEALDKRGIVLNGPWKVLSRVQIPIGSDDRFVWQEGGKEAYRKLMGKYLSPPRWKVRFARFEGDVTERTEEYYVYVSGGGEVVRVWHAVPEAIAGASLDRDEARRLAEGVLRGKYNLDPGSLKEISAEPSQLPERRDWSFTFADPVNYTLEHGEARIGIDIAGDEVSDTYRYVHRPEKWSREVRNLDNVVESAEGFSSSILYVVTLGGLTLSVVLWARRRYSARVFFVFLGVLFICHLADLVNRWPEIRAWFSTAEPVSNQIVFEIAFFLFSSVTGCGVYAVLAGLVHSWKRPQTDIGPSTALWLGVSLGFMISGLYFLMEALAPSLAPAWADYTTADYFLVTLGTGLAPLQGYIEWTVALLVLFMMMDKLTSGWRRRRSVMTAGLFAVVLAYTAVTKDNFQLWLAWGLAVSVFLLLAYHFVLRFSFALVPIVTGTFSALEVIKQAVLNAYPAATPGAALAFCLITVLSCGWFKALSADRGARRTVNGWLPRLHWKPLESIKESS